MYKSSSNLRFCMVHSIMGVWIIPHKLGRTTMLVISKQKFCKEQLFDNTQISRKMQKKTNYYVTNSFAICNTLHLHCIKVRTVILRNTLHYHYAKIADNSMPPPVKANRTVAVCLAAIELTIYVFLNLSTFRSLQGTFYG